jgi:hypothetical protein
MKKRYNETKRRLMEKRNKESKEEGRNTEIKSGGIIKVRKLLCKIKVNKRGNEEEISDRGGRRGRGRSAMLQNLHVAETFLTA